VCLETIRSRLFLVRVICSCLLVLVFASLFSLYMDNCVQNIHTSFCMLLVCDPRCSGH